MPNAGRTPKRIHWEDNLKCESECKANSKDMLETYLSDQCPRCALVLLCQAKFLIT